MKKTPIGDCYAQARELVAFDKDGARDAADKGIILVSQNVIKLQLKDEDIIEGVPIRLWYERFWIFLENNGLLLDGPDDPKDNYFYELMKSAELV